MYLLQKNVFRLSAHFVIGVWVLHVCWILSLYRYMIYKYLLPFGRLPFHFVDGFLWGSSSPFLRVLGRKFVLEVWACKVKSCCGFHGGYMASGLLWGRWSLGIDMLSVAKLISSVTVSWYHRHVWGAVSLWFTECWGVKEGSCIDLKGWPRSERTSVYL